MMVDENTFNTIRMLGHYQVLQTLGSGLQGKVKLGLNTTTQKLVALKLIDAKKLTKKSLLNVYREIEAMKRVTSHDHVLRLLEVHENLNYIKKNGEIKQVILIVIEVATGGELFDFMMYTGHFAEDIARTYFRQLIHGLEACHAQGVYHRDIKPENLLLDANFKLKIADFGLSALQVPSGRALDNGLGDNDADMSTFPQITEVFYTQCGTKAYMSPEILSGEAYEGAPADIWSAGVVLFIMLAGFPPFSIANGTDWWYRAISANQYTAFWKAHLRTASFSQNAMSLMSRIFQVDPYERATIAEIKSHPWFIAEDSTSSNPEHLQQELLQRKQKVEMAKQRERMDKMMEKHIESLEEVEEFDPFAMDVVRSIVANIDHQEVETNEELQLLTKTKPSSLYTSFLTKLTPKALQKRLTRDLQRLYAEDTSKNLDIQWSNGMAKVKFPLQDEKPLKLQIQFYTLCNNDDILTQQLTIVEVLRISGQSLAFQRVFTSLMEELVDIIHVQNHDDSQDTIIGVEELITDEALMI